MTSLRKYKFYIGIDTGVLTGLCIWSRFEKKIIRIETVKIHVAMSAVQTYHKDYPGEVLVRVEDARKAKYGRKLEGYKAKGAGSIMRDAKMWEDFLKDLAIDFEMVRPNNKITKWSIEAFQSLTRYYGVTSSHSRDACLLIYGK